MGPERAVMHMLGYLPRSTACGSILKQLQGILKQLQGILKLLQGILKLLQGQCSGAECDGTPSREVYLIAGCVKWDATFQCLVLIIPELCTSKKAHLRFNNGTMYKQKGASSVL